MTTARATRTERREHEHDSGITLPLDGHDVPATEATLLRYARGHLTDLLNTLAQRDPTIYTMRKLRTAEALIYTVETRIGQTPDDDGDTIVRGTE